MMTIKGYTYKTFHDYLAETFTTEKNPYRDVEFDLKCYADYLLEDFENLWQLHGLEAEDDEVYLIKKIFTYGNLYHFDRLFDTDWGYEVVVEKAMDEFLDEIYLTRKGE